MPERDERAVATGGLSGPRMPRRGFLKVGMIGTAVAVLGAVGLALRPSRLRPLPAGGLRHLTPPQYATATAVAECVCPSGHGFPKAADLDVGLKLDGFLDRADEDIRTQVMLALSLFESGLVAAVFGDGWTPFTQLDTAGRMERLRAWRDSRVGVRRAILAALRGISAALYFGDQRSWGATGYPGPPSAAALRTAFSGNLVDFSELRSQVDRRGPKR